MAGHSLDPAARLTVEGLPDPEEGAAISKVLRSIPFLIAGLCAAWAGAWLVEHGLSISRDGAHYLQVAFDVHFDGLRLGNPGPLTWHTFCSTGPVCWGEGVFSLHPFLLRLLPSLEQ